MLYLFSFFLLLGVSITLFMNLDPAFGGNPTKEQKENYQHLSNYANGKFVNEVPTDVMNSSDASSTNKDSTSEAKDRNPAGPIPVSAIDLNKIKSENDSLTWFGHSSFLLSIDNKKLLIDPMLSPIASPVSFVGVKRYNYSKDIMLHLIDEMPPIDAVFITHDHYDHL